MEGPIVNKVAQSELITLNLEDYYPKGEIVVFDLKDHLFMGLILKEKDFREALKNLDVEQYRDKNVAITCSADAIIPVWAYMLVVSLLAPVAGIVMAGTAEEVHRQLFLNNLAKINPSDYTDSKLVIKGCGDLPVGPFVYAEITRILRPVAKSIMYGEPCSTVPVYKKPMVKN